MLKSGPTIFPTISSNVDGWKEERNLHPDPSDYSLVSQPFYLAQPSEYSRNRMIDDRVIHRDDRRSSSKIFFYLPLSGKGRGSHSNSSRRHCFDYLFSRWAFVFTSFVNRIVRLCNSSIRYVSATLSERKLSRTEFTRREFIDSEFAMVLLRVKRLN